MCCGLAGRKQAAGPLFGIPGCCALPRCCLPCRVWRPCWPWRGGSSAPRQPGDRVAAGTPMLFFFERMALPDAQLVTPLALLLLALERTQARPQRGASLLAGAALAAVIMTKATALALLPLPLLALGSAAQASLARTPAHTGPNLRDVAGAVAAPAGAAAPAQYRLFGRGLAWCCRRNRQPVPASARQQFVRSGDLLRCVAPALMLLALLNRPRRAGLLALASLLAFFAVTLSGTSCPCATGCWPCRRPCCFASAG